MSFVDSTAYHGALRIARTLQGRGYQAFFAGGCVRDLLLQSAMPKDFDVATSATPDQVQQAFARSEAVGASFGVVLVIEGHGDDRIATEVATFRHDGAYTDGRRPDAVRYTADPHDDVVRRDFTVNGMLLDPVRLAGGEPLDSCLLDYVGGREDLKAELIRAIGDPARRFAEDKLRMLRAVRFAARLGFEIEPVTLAAIRAQAAENNQISAERVRDELTRMLTEGHAHRAVELLNESGLLPHVLPEVAAMQGVEQPPQYHPEGDVWTHTLMLLDHLPAGASPTLAWGMLLHDVGKPATFTPPDPAREGDRIRFNNHVQAGLDIARPLLSRLRFSNEDAEQILSLIQHHMQFGDVKKMKQSTLKRFLRLPNFDEHLALHFADVASSHGMLGMYEFVQQQRAALSEEHLSPPPLLTGNGLIAAGYKPGPQFKPLLAAVEDAQLDGLISTPEQAIELVRSLASAKQQEQDQQ